VKALSDLMQARRLVPIFIPCGGGEVQLGTLDRGRICPNIGQLNLGESMACAMWGMHDSVGGGLRDDRYHREQRSQMEITQQGDRPRTP